MNDLRKLPLVAVLALALPGSAALAQEAGACCVQSTGLVDGWLNPAVGSDEDFFTSRSGVPNINLIVDTSLSMLMWPKEQGPANDDCTDASMESADDPDAVYSPTELYEPEIRNLNAGTYYTEWFNRNKVYHIPYTLMTGVGPGGTDGYVSDMGRFPDGDGPSGQIDGAPWSGATRDAAIASSCSNIADATVKARCESCLRTDGYFHGTDARGRRAVGNFLNLYSPRYIMMRRTVKQVIRDMRKVRMSLATFSDKNDSLGDTDVPKLPRKPNPSCNQSNPFTNTSSFDSNRQSIINIIDDLDYNFTTPLARTLWMSGYLFQEYGSQKFNTHFPGWAASMAIPDAVVADFTEGSGANQRTICNKCMTNAIIVLTDGDPRSDTNTPVDATGMPGKVNQITVTGCTQCSDPAQAGSDFDEIAKYLYSGPEGTPAGEWDLHASLPDKQTVGTYTVAFGLDPTSWGYKLLQSAATHGSPDGANGFKSATSAKALKKALMDIINLVSERSTSFSSASVSPIQTEAVRLAAVLPRLSPKQTTPWWGEVWRFDLMNEFVEGVDKNGDGKFEDIFILDETGRIVVENDEGVFKIDADGDLETTNDRTEDADPQWEARQELITLGHDARTIYTVVDDDSNGRFDAEDDQIPFNTANVDRLLPYLGIAGAPNCPTGTANAQRGRIFEGLNLTVTLAAQLIQETAVPTLPTTQAEYNQLCAKVLIEWVRGRDLANEDKDPVGLLPTDNTVELIFAKVFPTRDDTRESVLGDIFHSSPIAAAGPVDRFLCDLGLSTQCVRTLYATDFSTAPTPLDTESVTVSICGTDPKTMDAYDAWHYKERRRSRVILVGANDGMLHAFHDGDPGTETCVGGRATAMYSGTSGRELWAFISPDQLPRLSERIHKHTYYVDGDIMVRDVWVDGSGATAADDRKQSDEFKTMAIIPEGRGGPHYFALQLNWTSTGAVAAPTLRWIFPQPCSPESAEFGKTLYSLAPKPPPIGPMLISADVFGRTGQDRGHSVNSVERWVATLSGGWSPGFEKGRGIYVVDAWAGAVNGRSDNLWWKFEHENIPSGDLDQTGPRANLTRGVAAPVAMVDYGEATSAQVDGYFDTAVFGDLGGQIWVTRMYQPGTATAGGLISNWSGGRALVMAKADPNLKRRSPFYYLPTVGVQTDNGAMRVYLGSGSRYSLLEGDVGECRFDNPQACAKYGCTTVRTTSTTTRPGLVSSEQVAWLSSVGSGDSTETSSAAGNYCGTGVGTVTVSGRVVETIDGCAGTVTGYNPLVRDMSYECGEFEAGSYTCRQLSDGGLPNFDVIPMTHSLTGLGRNRYYGIWAFGGKANRVFDEAETGTSTSSASAYDSRALTDRGTTDLVDVTGITCSSATNCTSAGAGYDDFGWFYEYDGLDRKTATGSTLLGGCTLWSGLYPEPPDGGAEAEESCLTSSVPRARFYQANYLSGLPNCASSFLSDGGFRRYLEIDTPAPPPEPAPVISINADGVMRVGVQMVPPGGAPQSFTVSQNNEPLQMIYELDVNRAMHNCRHVDGGVCPGITP